MNLIPEGWFENDGCTFWFDNWFGTSTTKCCDVHDAAFSYGTTVLEFLQANYNLMMCGVMDLHVPLWGVLAGIGATALGLIPFFTGNKKPKPVGWEVVTVIDPTQRHHSLRDGTGPGEAGSSSSTIEQERK